MTGTTQRYREEVSGLIAEALRLPVERVAGGLALGDVSQWDSLGHMDVLMALEARFAIPLEEDLITRLTSLEAICSYLEERDHA